MSWARVAAAVSILFFVPSLVESFDAPKAVAIRVLGAGAIAATLASALVRRRPATDGGRLGLRPLDLAMLAWVAVEALSTLTSQSPRLSLWGDDEQHEGLFTSLGLAGVYLSARLGAREPSDARRSLAFVVLPAVVASAYAIAQLLRLDPLEWSGAARYAAGQYARPFGTLGHPNLLGVVASAAWAIALAQALAGARPRWPWVAALAPLGVAAVASLSRGAWVALVVGSITAAAASRSAAATGLRSRGARLALLAGVALLVAMFASVDVLRSRLMDLLTPTTGSSRVRLEIWRSSLAMAGAHPWLGIGPDVYGLLFQHFQTPQLWRFEWGEWEFHSHSIYLHALATRGILGVAAAAAVLAALLVDLRSIARSVGECRALVWPLAAGSAALAAAGLFGALGNAGATVAALLLGSTASVAGAVSARAIVAAQPAPTGETRKPAAARRTTPLAAGRFPVLATWAGVAAAAAMVVPGRSMLLASRASFEARQAIQSPVQVMGRLAALAADRAVTLEPRNDRYAASRADVYLGYVAAAFPGYWDPPSMRVGRTPDATVRGWLSIADQSARQAIRLEPERAISYRTLGNVQMAYARLGAPDSLAAALETFRRCWALAPMDALNRMHFAFEATDLGRADLGLDAARQAVALYPDAPGGRAVLGNVYLALGDTANAISELERCLAVPWYDVPYVREELEQKLATLRGRDARPSSVE